MDIYVIIFTDTREILSPDSFREYWNKYGKNNALHWYGGPKKMKVYRTMAKARAGFAHISDELKPMLSIAKFAYSETLEDGGELQKIQVAHKAIRQKKKDEKIQMWRSLRNY